MNTLRRQWRVWRATLQPGDAIRMALALAWVLTLGAYGQACWVTLGERADRETVWNVYQSLTAWTRHAQSLAGQAPVTPLLTPENLIHALRPQLPPDAHLDRSLRLTLSPSGRGAQFQVLPNGSVQLIQWVNFGAAIDDHDDPGPLSSASASPAARLHAD